MLAMTLHTIHRSSWFTLNVHRMTSCVWQLNLEILRFIYGKLSIFYKTIEFVIFLGIFQAGSLISNSNLAQQNGSKLKSKSAKFMSLTTVSDFRNSVRFSQQFQIFATVSDFRLAQQLFPLCSNWCSRKERLRDLQLDLFHNFPNLLRISFLLNIRTVHISLSS